ncbi:DUF4214 domain-containing protein [Halomonas sp. CUBES01]|uniref:DUF4214 domain-containing protein n=1 Tax=Halomonas sp. CUBES01 TaxID=2897340 RepID=UPI001E5EDC3E|nr:DUF4214 domain-containing protein [Halomonas sp. CUBES01]MEC4766718.1 DUF4214 domain-containing protein [Halomonas sp. CUBES01]
MALSIDDVEFQNITAPNTPPTFDQDSDNNGVLSGAEAGGTANLTMAEDSGALGLINFLQVDDPDGSQTLTWSENGTDGPDNGSLEIESGTVNTPATDEKPFNAIYTPNTDFNGTDTFSIDVSDGTDTDTLQMTVTVTDAPDVTSVDVADGTYGLGDDVTVSVTFDEAVTVVTGTPTIDINVGGNIRTVDLDRGDGTTTLSGTYTIQSDDAADSIAIDFNAVSGEIVDNDGDGNSADLSHDAINDSGVTVDVSAPTISAVSIPNASARVGDAVTVSITAGEVGLSLDTGTVNGVPLTGFSDDGGGNYSATYTVQEGDADRAAGDDIPVNVILSDAAGNLSTPYNTSISQGGDAIDANSPNVGLPVLDAASDSGTSDSDNITDTATPTISGSTESGAAVTVRVDGSSVGTTTADGAGDWNFTFADGDLSEGANTVDILASDAAGNTSDDSGDLTLTLDTAAPTLSDDTSASVQENDPAGVLTGVNGAGDNVTDNDTGADTTAPVVAVNGNADGVASAVAGDNGGLFTVADDGSVRFDPNGDFDALATGDSETTGVMLTIRDAAGNTNTSTLSVQVTGANTAPTLTIGSAPTVNTGRTTTLDTTLLNGTDPDDDVADLTYILDSVPGSGTLKLSGTALEVLDSFTQQELIDGNLTFTAGSSTGDVSFDVFLVDDDFGSSPDATVTVKVTAPPPPPPTSPDPEPEPSPDTIDGAPATVTSTVDPDTGNAITEFEILPVTDGTRVNEDDATSDVDVDLSDRVRASISENLGLIATRRLDSSRDDLRTLINRPENEGDTDGPNSREVDDFLVAVSPSSDIVTVTPTRSGDATGDDRVTVRIAPTGEDNTSPVVVVDARQMDTGDTSPAVDITGAGSIVVRGSGTFRGDEELADGGAPDVDNVLGDNNAQTLFFGPGDDIIRGGGGDDVVGSAGGDDRLFGNSGDDELSGGAGADLLHGGRDTDVVRYEGNRDDYLITQDHSVITVQARNDSSDTDTLVNVESLAFADGEESITYDDDLSWITGLYDQVLGRQADVDGIQYWAQQHAEGLGKSDMARLFMTSAEASQSLDVQDDGIEGVVDTLYASLLGREADASGKAYWVDQLESGASLGDVVGGFMVSEEMRTHDLDATQWDFIA